MLRPRRRAGADGPAAAARAAPRQQGAGGARRRSTRCAAGAAVYLSATVEASWSTRRIICGFRRCGPGSRCSAAFAALDQRWTASWAGGCRSRSTRSSAFSRRARRTREPGMRASVLIHLPGLVLTKEIGEGAGGAAADGADLSRAVRRGQRSRRELLPDLEPDDARPVGGGAGSIISSRVVRHVIEREEEARRVLLRDAGYIIEDKLWRAYGTLRYARSLTFDEAMNYLSGVRLAVGSETDQRPQCIYPQQAPDLLSGGAPGVCGRTRAD